MLLPGSRLCIGCMQRTYSALTASGTALTSSPGTGYKVHGRSIYGPGEKVPPSLNPAYELKH